MAVLTGGGIGKSGITTVDLYHLTDDLDLYTVDYFPYHSSYSTHFSSGSLETFNLPITNPGRGLSSPTKISHSYFYDFYFRIHYSETNINAGLALSTQNYAIEMWNSYLNDNTLSSITYNSLTSADISLALDFTLPHTFKPLESSFLDLSVLPNNTPTVAGSLTFNWTSESSGISITATHVSIWPFPALINFTETRAWLTDVIPTRTSEQRFATREVPRMVLSYKFRFLSTQEYTTARNIARNKVHEPMAVPLFSEVIKLTNLSIGQFDVLFDTSYLEIEVGDLLIFWEDYLHNETLEILAIQPDKVTLKNPLTRSYNKVCVAVVKSGYIIDGIRFSESEASSREGSLDIEITNPFSAASWPNSEIYKTLPVLTVRNISSGGIESSFTREQNKVDSLTGIYTVIDDELYNRGTYQVSLSAHNRRDRYVLKRQLDYLKGRYSTFWIRSSIDNLKNITDIIANNNSLKVLSTLGSSNKYTDIYINGSREAYFSILNITNNLDGTESITLSPTPTTAITDIKTIQLMMKVRADTDSFTINYDSGIMSVKFIVKEVS